MENEIREMYPDFNMLIYRYQKRVEEICSTYKMQVSYVQKQMYSIWFSKYRKLKKFSSENYRLFHLKRFL